MTRGFHLQKQKQVVIFLTYKKEGEQMSCIFICDHCGTSESGVSVGKHIISGTPIYNGPKGWLVSESTGSLEDACSIACAKAISNGNMEIED